MSKKARIMIVCMLISTLVLTACNGGGDKKTDTKSSVSLYERGMELTAIISELSKNEQYVDAVLPSRESSMQELFDSIKGMDYSKPEHVYRIKNMDEVVSAGMVMLTKVDVDKCSEAVKKHLEKRLVNAISNYIIGQRTSVTALAVSSCFITETSFTDASVKDYEVYIYTYQNAYPVMVCFVPGKDGSVVASAGYIIVDDFIGADEETLSEDISFTMLNIKLEEVFK